MANRNEIKSNIGFSLNLFIVSLLLISCNNNPPIPQEWVSQWQNPPADFRPLQIVHAMDLRNPEKQNLKGKNDPAGYLRDSCGLGGVVCNVERGKDYLLSSEDWKRFVDGVKNMRENNMRVWIYDEDGYPSLSAGGLVLEGHPELESLEMAYDQAHAPMFYSRPSYEFTHASNNFAEARRYPNPLNKLATERFIELTHKAYLDHLGSELFSEMEAFFTDEPSLMAVNIAKMQHSSRVQDPVDSTKKELPVIPWAEDIPEKYKQRYNEDLMPHLLSLFEGDTPIDKDIRQKFWSLVGELDKAYYYDAIQNWCKEVRLEHQNKGPVSSGHGLREESIITHVPLDGNKIQVLTGFDIPGLDFLDSDPKAWMATNGSFAGNWQAAALPVSAAQLTGKRRVMCEMSDFLQTMAGKGPASLEEMQASTAWQMAWGVTDFNLYYRISYGDKYPFRNECSYKSYCDFVGRINSIIKDAKPVKSKLLYYPIYNMQREYQPKSTTIGLDTQNEKVRQIENSFHQIGLLLSQNQIPFVLVDYLFLEQSKINKKGTIELNGEEFDGLVLPQGVSLPPKVEALVEKMKENGVNVISIEQNTGEQISLIASPEKLIPSRSDIAYGKFTRKGHDIYLLVNSGTEIYRGNLTVLQQGNWSVMNPQTSEITLVNSVSDNGKTILPISLRKNQTLIYISN